jgi:hypothetical protein
VMKERQESENGAAINAEWTTIWTINASI